MIISFQWGSEGDAAMLRRRSSGEYLFPSLKKEGCRITGVKKGFNAAVKEGGMADFHFHSAHHVRNSGRSHGVAMNAIADIMDHADIHTTRRYAHSTDEPRQKAVAAVEIAG
jgi:integrase